MMTRSTGSNYHPPDGHNKGKGSFDIDWVNVEAHQPIVVEWPYDLETDVPNFKIGCICGWAPEKDQPWLDHVLSGGGSILMQSVQIDEAMVDKIAIALRQLAGEPDDYNARVDSGDYGMLERPSEFAFNIVKKLKEIAEPQEGQS